MAAIDDVLSWATTLPAWQGDALRRLFQAADNPLDATDYAEVLALAKAELNLAPAPEGIAPNPAAPGMFSGAPTCDVSMKLLSIDNVQHVNIIKSGQSQPFGETGVTVIYGDNGAGKSGYARILKLACNARDKEDFILPNVFSSGKAGTPTATLKIKDADGIKDIQWVQGNPPDSILTNVSVFDGRCARVITDKRNEITYLPYGCDVIPKLAALVGRIKDDLTAEITTQTPIQDSSITAGTPSAEFLSSLSANTTNESIDAATAWSPEDDAELLSQQELAVKSNTDKATAEVERLTRIKTRIVTSASTASDLSAKCSQITNEKVSNVITELNAAKKAHEIAVAERKQNEPLVGVGSTNQWQILYEAAKKYSEEVAYVGEDFPKTNDAVCVFCQQPLGQDAVARFARFKMFMEDATSAVFTTKRGALRALRVETEAILPLSGVALTTICDEVTNHSASAAVALREYHEKIDSRRTAILNALVEGESPDKAEKLPAWPTAPIPELNAITTTLDTQIVAIASASKPEEHKAIIAKITNLSARKALRARVAEIKQYVEMAKRNAALAKAAGSLRTQEITRQGTTIVRKTLTPELLKALEQELKALGAANRVPVSVKPVGGDGETAHEMLLQGATSTGKNRMSQVLSEGEARVVALAGFLAELKLTPHTNAIVFDDPVSSLDHIFTRRIAERLVREGATRQVIVFTHNIAFLMEVEAAKSILDELGTHADVCVHTLRRNGPDAGVTTNGLPWHAAKVGPRITYLQALVGKIKSEYQQDMTIYNKEAAHVYGLLREAWEACIEESLLNATVCRFRNSVETRRLKAAEITDADFGIVNGNMSKVSTWMTGHDKAKGLHEDRPSPTEMLGDIEALRQFTDGVNKRRSVIEARR